MQRSALDSLLSGLLGDDDASPETPEPRSDGAGPRPVAPDSALAAEAPAGDVVIDEPDDMAAALAAAVTSGDGPVADGVEAGVDDVGAAEDADGDPEADPTAEAEAQGEATELRDVGEWLLREGVIDAAQLTQGRKVQKQTPGRRLGEILIDMGVDEAAVQRANAELAGLPFERIDPEHIDEKYLHRLGVEYCKANGLLPLRESGTRVVLGVVEPHRLFMLDEVREKLGRPVKVIMVTAGDIALVAEAYSDQSEGDVVVDDIIKDIAEDDVEVVEESEDDVDLEKQAGQSPVIRFVNYLIYDAVKNGASDIHIEPQEKRLRIRYRIDGVLFEAMNPPHGMHAAIVSRLKIMANLDISE